MTVRRKGNWVASPQRFARDRDAAAEYCLAFYPGPDRPTQSPLGLSTSSQSAAHSPVLGEHRPDVEALLSNPIDGAREYYRVPIDCYHALGLSRTHWRGVCGGNGLRRAMKDFMNDLRERKDETGAYHHG